MVLASNCQLVFFFSVVKTGFLCWFFLVMLSVFHWLKMKRIYQI